MPVDDHALAFLGVGWGFPLAPVDGKLQWAVHEQSVEQAIRILLHTAPGERVMLPKLGAGLGELVFEPNSAATHRAVESAIRAALTDWEPRIDVIRVEATAKDEPNVLRVELDYRVRATNTFYNRVFPFHLLEGEG